MAMAYLFDAVSSLLSCCFPDPQIKLNHRSFKILRLLGEGYEFDVPRVLANKKGILIRLPRHRLEWVPLRSEKDSLSLWPGVCAECTKGSRSV